MSDGSDDGGAVAAFLMTQKLAARLVEGPSRPSQQHPPKPMKACIAVAGGGSGAASAIAATPGASSLLLESIVAYDRRSFAEFVAGNVDGEEGWLVQLELAMESAKVSTEESMKGEGTRGAEEEFKFSSAEAATLLSRAALRRSLELTPSFRGQSLHCMGVGCTSSLVGKVASNGEVVGGRKGRRSRAYVALSSLKRGTRVWEVMLDGEEKSNRRTRAHEEAAVSSLVLLAMARYREGCGELLGSTARSDGGADVEMGLVLDRGGDSIVEKSFVVNNGGTSVAEGASRIIEGDAQAVAVLPVESVERAIPSSSESDGSTTQRPHGMEALFTDGDIPFPQDVLVVPGSFNPPHAGHVGLANAAVRALRRLRERERLSSTSAGASPRASSSSSSRLLRSLHSTLDRHLVDQRGDPAVLFEMSVTNADKPPLDPSEVQRRADFFRRLREEGDMPEDWALVLTNAPLFAQKADVLDGLIPGSGAGGLNGAGTQRKMSFVLGTDTFVRIINPKYYGDSRENMLAALRDMRAKGAHFIVGGRLEQGAGDSPTFVNGEEEAASLPPDVREMFTLLTEDEFRLDISSTELRKKMGESAR